MAAHTEDEATPAADLHGGLASGLAGCEWVVDALECGPEQLRDLATLRGLCDQIVESLGLNVIGTPAWHQFPGHAGVTGLYLLSESHLACHTYPEFALATFNLYCCRPLPHWPWQEVLKDRLAAGRVEVLEIARGGGARGLPIEPPRARR